MLGSLLPLAVLIAVGAVFFARQPDRRGRGRYLRHLAFGFMAVVTVFFVVFVVAETIADPGGLAAVGLIAAWFVPLDVLGLLAWYRPEAAVRVLAALTAVVVAMTAWAAAQSGAWRSFEDDHGPVRTVVVFVLAAAVAVLGLRRPREAGWLLLALGLMPLAVSSIGGHLALGSLFAAVTPALIAGVLFLAAATLGGGSPPKPPVGQERLSVG